MTVDAISHMVLPGMVAAFLLFGTVSFLNMFWGAMAAALLGIILIEGLSRLQDRNAVLGMVFSVFFALGILLLELFVDKRVHLDVMHVLFGSLESVYWRGLGEEGTSLFSWEILKSMPRTLIVLATLFLFLLFCLLLFYKEIVLASFDGQYAMLQLPATRWMDYGLSLVVTFTVVAAFKLVGLILIVGMFVIPPLMASFITRRLPSRFLVSGILSVLLCVLGYGLAVYVPAILVGVEFSFNVGGTIVFLGALATFIIVLVRKGLWQLISH